MSNLTILVSNLTILGATAREYRQRYDDASEAVDNCWRFVAQATTNHVCNLQSAIRAVRDCATLADVTALRDMARRSEKRQRFAEAMLIRAEATERRASEFYNRAVRELEAEAEATARQAVTI